MMKSLFSLAAIAATAALPAHAQSSGELLFTAFNADEDGFAMVTLVDLPAGTKVWFSDNEWDGVAAFNSGESYSSWTTTTPVLAGTVVRFSATDSATLLAASTGSYVREALASNTNYGFSQTEDTLYAYLGTSATTPTTFLSAVSTSTYGSAAGGSLAGTGLAVGNGAVQLAFGSDFGQYAGARTGQTAFGDYKSLVSNVANWQDLGDGTYATTVPDTTAFTTSPIPEPSSYAMMLAGMAALGFIASRRRR